MWKVRAKLYARENVHAMNIPVRHFRMGKIIQRIPSHLYCKHFVWEKKGDGEKSATEYGRIAVQGKENREKHAAVHNIVPRRTGNDTTRVLACIFQWEFATGVLEERPRPIPIQFIMGKNACTYPVFKFRGLT